MWGFLVLVDRRESTLVNVVRRAARKVLNAKTPAQSTQGLPTLDNAPGLPRGPRNVHLGTQLQGCLPITGLGLY